MKAALLLAALAATLSAQVPTVSATTTLLREGDTTAVNCTANCTSLVWKVNGITNGNATVGTITGSGAAVTYTAPASTTANQELYGCTIGYNDSIWNTPAAGLPIISNWRGDPFLNNAWYQFYETLQDSPNNGRVWVGTNLQVNSNIGMSYADSSSPTADVSGTYTGFAIHGFPYPTWPAHYREGGTYDFSNSNDHHTLTMRSDTCNLYEVYNEQLSPLVSCLTGGGQCYAASGIGYVTQGRYNWNGGTDAGGGELSPYTVHLSEVKSGVIKHVMHGRIPGQINSNPNNLMFPATYGAGSCNVKEIVGWTVTSGGSGYSPATKITVSGGGQATPANKFTPILSGGVLTGLTMIHSAFNGDTGGWNSFTSAPTLTVSDTGGGTGATVTATIDYPCIPMGARWVLKSTYLTNHTGSGCPAGSNCLTGAGLTVATALNAYGMFDLDNNGTTLFSVDMSPDLYYDPTVYNQIHGQIPTIPFSAFDIVDQSKLAISTANGVDNQAGCSGSPCSISQVQPDNDLGLTVPGSVWITATNASGSSLSADVSLIPPTIGTLDELIYVKAGDYSGSKGTSGGIQIPYWIHGVSGSPTVAWTCASCTGSVTTAGIYTPPASLSTTGTQDVLVGTLSSDANVTKTIYVTLLPNAGNYVASTIRADVANSSNFGPDGNAHYWVGNIGAKTGDVSLSNTTLKYGTNPQEATVYATAYYSTSEDDHHYKFYLPNGNYRVRILTGWIDNQSITVTSWNHMPGHALVTDGGTDGVFKFLHWNIMEAAGMPYASSSNSDMVFGARITNNVIEIDNSNDWPSPGGWPSCNANGGQCFSAPSTSGIEVTPDATAPHWEIGLTNGVPPSAVTTRVTNKPTVALNSTTTLYLRDWYTGINDPVWTLVSGPGSLTTTTTQLSMTENVPIAQYKAPASQPHGGQGIVIQAQSASNPNLQATVMLQINGGGGPGNGSTFFK